ncbi:hypothetical protein CONPUDRAFT_159695 [Coniophora puteana RWD-64-598 SS2]|uniref:Uncharacterized protein n=1 Tax=Coniophora puteana (strain RWD-64-598) TaxID=741705 RepID=A0A5M3M7T9_CONPW|nr:uncharacterized protein CONPUDRAFT_159695 [Coniophora puteana RWD-64-598 SS2]EIW74924.1 hypothetical protein CONPUDRAFT_159695 [Coniophora puteana RWD-64-598 SS2]
MDSPRYVKMPNVTKWGERPVGVDPRDWPSDDPDEETWLEYDKRTGHVSGSHSESEEPIEIYMKKHQSRFDDEKARRRRLGLPLERFGQPWDGRPVTQAEARFTHTEYQAQLDAAADITETEYSDDSDTSESGVNLSSHNEGDGTKETDTGNEADDEKEEDNSESESASQGSMSQLPTQVRGFISILENHIL